MLFHYAFLKNENFIFHFIFHSLYSFTAAGELDKFKRNHSKIFLNNKYSNRIRRPIIFNMGDDRFDLEDV